MTNQGYILVWQVLLYVLPCGFILIFMYIHVRTFQGSISLHFTWNFKWVCLFTHFLYPSCVLYILSLLLSCTAQSWVLDHFVKRDGEVFWCFSFVFQTSVGGPLPFFLGYDIVPFLMMYLRETILAQDSQHFSWFLAYVFMWLLDVYSWACTKYLKFCSKLYSSGILRISLSLFVLSSGQGFVTSHLTTIFILQTALALIQLMIDLRISQVEKNCKCCRLIMTLSHLLWSHHQPSGLFPRIALCMESLPHHNSDSSISCSCIPIKKPLTLVTPRCAICSTVWFVCHGIIHFIYQNLILHYIEHKINEISLHVLHCYTLSVVSLDLFEW